MITTDDFLSMLQESTRNVPRRMVKVRCGGALFAWLKRDLEWEHGRYAQQPNCGLTGDVFMISGFEVTKDDTIGYDGYEVALTEEGVDYVNKGKGY